MKFELKIGTSDSEKEFSFEFFDAVTTADGGECSVKMNEEVLPVKIAGIDPLNAVENAIGFMRSFMRNSDTEYFWVNGEKYEDIT